MKRLRICPECGNRLTSGSPTGRAYVTQDGRRVVGLTWRHRVPRHGGAPSPDCSATWPEEKAKDPGALVHYEAAP